VPGITPPRIISLSLFLPLLSPLSLFLSLAIFLITPPNTPPPTHTHAHYDKYMHTHTVRYIQPNPSVPKVSLVVNESINLYHYCLKFGVRKKRSDFSRLAKPNARRNVLLPEECAKEIPACLIQMGVIGAIALTPSNSTR